MRGYLSSARKTKITHHMDCLELIIEDVMYFASSEMVSKVIQNYVVICCQWYVVLSGALRCEASSHISKTYSNSYRGWILRLVL